MEMIPKSGQVYVVQYNKEVLDRSTIYCAIPCLLKDKYEDGEPCSVRWQKLCKGKPGGFFPSGMIVDMWLDGEAWHTKVYKSGAVHMTGIPDKETAIRLAKALGRILNNACEYINEMRKSQLFEEAVRWLIDNSIGPVFQCISMFSLPNNLDLGTMEFSKATQERSIAWPDNIPQKYKAIIDTMRVLCDDTLRNTNAPHCALVSRIETFLNANYQKGGYEVVSARLCNAIYNTNLGCHINRYELNNIFETIGYDTHFSNTTTSEVQVFVKIDDVVAKFYFYPGGAVRLSCTSEEVAKKAFVKVMEDVRANLHRISL